VLSSFAGTYRWVFKTQTVGTTVEFRYESDPEVEEAEFPGFPGFFTISFPEGEEPTFDNLTGKFRLAGLQGTFTGVESNCESMPNHWAIKEMQWAPGYSTRITYGIVEGHALNISDLLDDNGDRFITFAWHQGYSACIPHDAYWTGKKQADENALVGLSDAEREQMGMYLTREQVERNANHQIKEEDDIGSGESGSKRKVEEDDRDVKHIRED